MVVYNTKKVAKDDFTGRHLGFYKTAVGDVIAVMDRGRMEQAGIPYEIYHSLFSRFVAQFIGTPNFIPRELRNVAVETELGNAPTPRKHLDHRRFETMLRPDDVTISPSEDSRGVIISSISEGVSYVYGMLLDSRAPVHSVQLHSLCLNVGTRATLGFESHYPRAYFLDRCSVSDDVRKIITVLRAIFSRATCLLIAANLRQPHDLGKKWFCRWKEYSSRVLLSLPPLYRISQEILVIQPSP